MGVSDVKGPFDQNLMLSSSRRQSYQSRFLSRHSTDSCHQNFLGDSARSPRDVTDQQYCHPLDKGGDADLVQRRRDEEWLKTFLFRRKRSPVLPKPIDSRPSISQFREKLYSAVKLVAELSATCETLKHNLENETVWTETYSKAVTLKSGLQDKLNSVCDPLVINTISKKLVKIRKKRIQGHRRKLERIEEKHREEARSAEREAAIDKWRTRCILVVEEKKREQELKLAADAVLSEVRRKQADAKRMLDILKSLEKLRKLRKEAASRKGIFPEKECDESFEEHVGRLRDLIRKRTAVYGAEERALRVMLEGEQEENRKRELEKRQKKERERLQQKRQELEMALFGAELPPDHPLQPFHDYYTQAEHSLPALIQIRKEWDLYLVPFDHPDGSSVPHTWVFPDPPADEIWATALDK
ncbi:programmed cell death protein 7 [Chanos chanos]|uniref:Programmed cell death protein 7 n=1 Tax=Chanos chanos TaxID=29144 RepID=A0A6J2ULM3_CHACN|nr:programmed cell death protein 7 [Chanos chanos]